MLPASEGIYCVEESDQAGRQTQGNSLEFEGGLEVRYQEGLPDLHRSQTWVSGGEGTSPGG